MRIRYPEDEWRWFWDNQENWYCSHECASSDGAPNNELYRVDTDFTSLTDDEHTISLKCQTCKRYFDVPYDWEYRLRKP